MQKYVLFFLAWSLISTPIANSSASLSCNSYLSNTNKPSILFSTSDEWVETLNEENKLIVRKAIDKLIEIILTAANNTRFEKNNPYALVDLLNYYGIDVDIDPSSGFFIFLINNNKIRSEEISNSQKVKMRYLEEMIRKRLRKEKNSGLLYLYELLFSDLDFFGEMSESQLNEIAKKNRLENKQIINNRTKVILRDNGFWFKHKYYHRDGSSIDYSGIEYNAAMAYYDSKGNRITLKEINLGSSNRKRTDESKQETLWFKDSTYLEELRRKRETPIEFYLRTHGL